MQTKLRLFLDWGISFGEPYQTPEHGQRKVYYADRRELEAAILKKYPPPQASESRLPTETQQSSVASRSRSPLRRADSGDPPLRP